MKARPSGTRVHLSGARIELVYCRPPSICRRTPARRAAGCGGQAYSCYSRAVDASKFTPSNNGEWLAPLTCVGGDNTGKFTTAAHIRSIRFDFEKSPKEVLTRARTHPDDRENDTMSSYMGRDDGHMLYDVDEWRFLASHVMDDVVYIASDNAPARDELAMRIADLGGTACFVARTSGHSSWHYSDEADDHALTDWWYLAQARTIHQIDLRCRGRTAHSCQFNRKRCPRGSVKRGRNNAGMGHCRGSSFSHAAHRLYAGTRTRAYTRNCLTLSSAAPCRRLMRGPRRRRRSRRWLRPCRRRQRPSRQSKATARLTSSGSSSRSCPARA